MIPVGRIKADIRRAQMTERQIAEKHGVSRQWVNRIAVAMRAGGRIKGPTPREISSLKRAAESERLRRERLKRIAFRAVLVELRSRNLSYVDFAPLLGMTPKRASSLVRRWS